MRSLWFLVTYDPGRRGGVAVSRRCEIEGRELPAHSEIRIAADPGRARSNSDDHQQWRKQTRIGRFVSTYGWRAYALPVLIVLTVVVVYQTITGTSAPHSAQEDDGPVQGPPTIDAASTAIIGAPPKGLTQFDANLPTGILPAGGQFTEAGARAWRIVPGTTPKIGEGTTKAFHYTVEVEDGVDTTAFGGDDGFARMVSRDAGQSEELDAQRAVRVHLGG